MSKGLEALENIRYLIVFDERVVDEYGDEEPIKIFLDEELPEDYKTIEKSLKALEIIKEFNAYSIEQIQGQWYLFKGDANVRNTNRKPITEETAMLLKEVLLCQ